MQKSIYNIKDKSSVILWRALPVELEITGIDDISGNWRFLLDNNWVDGAIITGTITKSEGKLIVNIDNLDNNYIFSAINGKSQLDCFATLTNDVNKCFLIPITILNRTTNTAPAPTPATSYYTKLETDDKFSTKTQLNNLSSTVYGDIENLAENYWTKQETAEAIANVQTMDIVVVQQLPPVAEAHEYTIYLAPATQTETGNYYDEYLLINGAFEKIGSTAIDLSNYVERQELANYLQKTGGVITTLKLLKDENTPLFTFNNGTTLYGYAGLLFYSTYSNHTHLVTTAQTTIQNDTLALSGKTRLRLVSNSNNLLYNEHAQNTAGGICVLDANGNLIVPGILSTSGKDLVQLQSATFAPENGKIYSLTLTGNTTLTLNTSSQNNVIDFELHLVQGNTAYNVTWPNGIKWGDDEGVFSSSNQEPDITTANTEYAITGRIVGNKILMNLAYTQEL